MMNGSTRTLPTPIYISGDTHFNHDKLIEWGRPEAFEGMELAALSKIPAEAYLLHLGDFCIGDDEEQHKRFMSFVGHIEHRVLVRGNHDNKSNSWYLKHGWHAVVDALELTVMGRRVVFTHIPVDPDARYWCKHNVHAHTHGNAHRDKDVGHLLRPGYHIEYAPELFDYAPMLLNEKVFRAAEMLKELP